MEPFQVDSLPEAIDRYGISVVVIAAFFWSAWYIGRRLFNPENGIITQLGERHVAFLDATERTQRELAQSQVELTQSIGTLAKSAEVAHRSLGKRDEKLEQIIGLQRETLEQIK